MKNDEGHLYSWRECDCCQKVTAKAFSCLWMDSYTVDDIRDWLFEDYPSVYWAMDHKWDGWTPLRVDYEFRLVDDIHRVMTCVATEGNQKSLLWSLAGFLGDREQDGYLHSAKPLTDTMIKSMNIKGLR